MPSLKRYWPDSLNQRRSASYGKIRFHNSDWPENGKSAVGKRLEMGGRARNTKFPEWTLPHRCVAQGKGEEGRAAGRRGILDDPGTGWSLFISSLTFWVEYMDGLGHPGRRGRGERLSLAGFLSGSVHEPVTDKRNGPSWQTLSGGLRTLHLSVNFILQEISTNPHDKKQPL